MVQGETNEECRKRDGAMVVVVQAVVRRQQCLGGATSSGVEWSKIKSF